MGKFYGRHTINTSSIEDITNTRLFKYMKNFTCKKTKNFQIKKNKKKKKNSEFFFFHISAQNIDCGYSLL